eukprot:COSAG06_NODE_11262_length_1536_cov_10.524704_2_plen_105_part_00
MRVVCPMSLRCCVPWSADVMLWHTLPFTTYFELIDQFGMSAGDKPPREVHDGPGANQTHHRLNEMMTFYTKSDHFTKTGSGQTQGKSTQKGEMVRFCLFRRWLM